MITRDYLLSEVRDRQRDARAKAIHYGRLQSACAKADQQEALNDLDFLTRVLEALEARR